ncbi:hypothetical protein Hamer_G028813 [Homarus americanus]|uniref:Uncharacterized protein n=1 Tax=Homarus americanus TaxID=6706 RepID=A0A8J5TJN7_HOMAM|nr:hypothetical protein Hamer_G028813 [Homarus americanus]
MLTIEGRDLRQKYLVGERNELSPFPQRNWNHMRRLHQRFSQDEGNIVPKKNLETGRDEGSDGSRVSKSNSNRGRESGKEKPKEEEERAWSRGYRDRSGESTPPPHVKPL